MVSFLDQYVRENRSTRGQDRKTGARDGGNRDIGKYRQPGDGGQGVEEKNTEEQNKENQKKQDQEIEEQEKQKPGNLPLIKQEASICISIRPRPEASVTKAVAAVVVGVCKEV